MPSAATIVESEVRELVRRRGLDPAVQSGAVRQLVEEVVADYADRSVTSSLPPLVDATSVGRSVFDAVAGFGPLQPLLDDPSIEEVWINGRLTHECLPFLSVTPRPPNRSATPPGLRPVRVRSSRCDVQGPCPGLS